MPRKLTEIEFIERVNKKFNGSINVSNFKYVNNNTKGLCICNKCGNKWYTIPNSLFNGHGCRKCYDKRNSEKRKISLEEIKATLETNGSNVEIINEYIDTKHKCRIRCKTCGNEWEAKIGQYLKGSGCPICKHGRMTTDFAIKKLEVIYGDKYFFNKVIYKNNQTKITLTCKKHGDFTILPSTAFKNNKEKCPICLKEEKEIKNKKKTVVIKVKKDKKNKELPQNKISKNEDFILKCKAIHSNEPYDYSVTNYINSKTKVKVLCLKHGIFEKSPLSLLNGQRCPLCARTGHKYTNEEWIRLAKEKYPEIDYSKVNYINKDTKIVLICNEVDKDGVKHGEFSVYPNAFLRGECKCAKCIKEEKRLNKEKEFISKSNIIHSNKYDYSKVYYDGNHKKVCIKCPEHGEFWQIPLNHVKGCKCPQCAIENTKSLNKIKKNEFHNTFIEKAKLIHGNKYNYEKVIYDGNETKVKIICPIHGDFEQTPHSHLNGGGCPKCAREKIVDSVRLTQEEFIERVKYIHRYKNYDFSKINYTTCNKDVTVYCPKHGDFNIKAISLLTGIGCPICRLSKLEIAVRNALIDNKIQYTKQKRFKKWLGNQSLDFYIDEKKIAIECQGVQHFKNERWYTKLDEIQERDKRKKELCKENNIHLIYYVPEIFSEYMKEDDIYFTNINEMIRYINEYKEEVIED